MALMSAWNPRAILTYRHTIRPLDLSGKGACKRALQREFGLPNHSVPLLAVIGRLTFQKGFDLLIEVIPELMSLDTNRSARYGDHQLEQQFIAIKAKYPNRIGLCLGLTKEWHIALKLDRTC